MRKSREKSRLRFLSQALVLGIANLAGNTIQAARDQFFHHQALRSWQADRFMSGDTNVGSKQLSSTD